MKWVNGTDTIVVSIGALRILVPYVQFKKRKKHPCRSVNFSKVAGLKLTLLHGCFLHFLNCTNGTKSCNAPHFSINAWTGPGKNFNVSVSRDFQKVFKTFLTKLDH